MLKSAHLRRLFPVTVLAVVMSVGLASAPSHAADPGLQEGVPQVGTSSQGPLAMRWTTIEVGKVNADNVATATYRVVVRNHGADPVRYSVVERVRLSPMLLRRSTEARNLVPGTIATNRRFNASTRPQVVTDQRIPAGGRHVFEVSVRFQVNTAMSAEQQGCELITVERGRGTVRHPASDNRGAVMVKRRSVDRTDCR